VLAVFRLLGVSFSPSRVLCLVVLFVAFNEELHVVCLLVGSVASAHLRFLEIAIVGKTKRCVGV
jgi:hypothetical protein